MNQCCILRFAIKGFREGFKAAPYGARFTCSGCGQSFKKADRWEPISTVDDILDMMKQERARQGMDDDDAA